MAWILLRPWLRTLIEAGTEVHLACNPTRYFDLLRAEGINVHAVPIHRSFNPLAHFSALLCLYRVARRGRFGVMSLHSPVAAAVGRLAGWLAGCPRVVYTVHGFYFHDNMPRMPRALFLGIEWLLGALTDHFFFVSEEDYQMAVRLGIARSSEQATLIANGVNLVRYHPVAHDSEIEGLRLELGIPSDSPVVGIVGRLVKEKGYREFFRMAQSLADAGERPTFLVVGDSLPSDRDQFGPRFRKAVAKSRLAPQFVFAGFTDRVDRYLRAMDIFVLPSYREGMPRSVLEAMATGLPVVASRIRGCREAVVPGETGFLVPPGDADALSRAVLELLRNPRQGREMGRAGLRRAQELYDDRIMCARIAAAFSLLLTPAV
jgi:glycosyltransferase involved in cell wall biosynthesis